MAVLILVSTSLTDSLILSKRKDMVSGQCPSQRKDAQDDTADSSDCWSWLNLIAIDDYIGIAGQTVGS